MELVYPVTVGINWVLAIAAALLGVFALIDALSRRPDAYAAADKQTKGTWTGITVACAVVLVLGLPGLGFFQPQSLLWLAGVVGALVYLLDVRPRLREVQSGGRW